MLALGGVALLVLRPSLAPLPAAAAAGFSLILLTAGVQLVAPALGWLQIEESVAALAGMLIVGLGEQRVNVLSVLWLSAVASGVLARGGRVHWVGRAVMLSALGLPIITELRLRPEHLGLCVAAIGLLLTCGRLTRELNHLLKRARHDADHDGLTGALSRAAFRATLSDLDERAGVPAASLLLIDLDNFGQINKLHGHAAGDALLAATVARVRATVGPGCPIGRLGGDEFATLVRDDAPSATARLLVEELSAPVEGVTVAASVGIACAPVHGRGADALLRAADVALRVAKRTGKHQVSTYAGGSFGDDGPRGARGALARLIAGDGVVMHVQPIVDTRRGEVHAFEALARFQTRGTESPLHWFALADEFGLRNELELACLAAGLKLLETRPGGSRLSLNLSWPALIDSRVQALLANQPDLSGLIIEITEQALAAHDTSLLAVTAPLLARGVSFAVDDMGAGYSGLRQITTLHPSYLKLDRSLVRGIDSDSDRAALIEALLGYARHTGGELVAEGVETIEELRTIKGLGVSLIQGFYFGRPAPPWPQLVLDASGAPLLESGTPASQPAPPMGA